MTNLSIFSGHAVEKYYNNLDMLLHIMQKSGQSSCLTADLPFRVLNNRQHWKARLDFTNGQVTKCFILNDSGEVVFSGKQALQSLRTVGALTWISDPRSENALPDTSRNFSTQISSRMPALSKKETFSTPAITREQKSIGSSGQGGLLPAIYKNISTRLTSRPRPLSNPGILSGYPKRTTSVSPQMMQDWPRNHRRVYVLIDDERSAEKIRSMVNLAPAEIEEILLFLRSMGVITIVEYV